MHVSDGDDFFWKFFQVEGNLVEIVTIRLQQMTTPLVPLPGRRAVM